MGDCLFDRSEASGGEPRRALFDWKESADDLGFWASALLVDFDFSADLDVLTLIIGGLSDLPDSITVSNKHVKQDKTVLTILSAGSTMSSASIFHPGPLCSGWLVCRFYTLFFTASLHSCCLLHDVGEVLQ